MGRFQNRTIHQSWATAARDVGRTSWMIYPTSMFWPSGDSSTCWPVKISSGILASSLSLAGSFFERFDLAEPALQQLPPSLAAIAAQHVVH